MYKEDKDKKGVSKLFIIALILCALAVGLMFLSYNNGINISGGSKNIKEYKSISELESNPPFELKLPSFVKDEEEMKIKCTMGSMLEIDTRAYILKAATFVDNNADPLALYDKAKEDVKFTVNNSDITYLRVRTGYKEYENCTLINWVDGEIAYGLIWADKAELADILITLNINESDLEKYTDSSSSDSDTTSDEDNTSDIKFDNITVGDMSLSVPHFETSELTYADLKDMLLFSMDDKMVFVVIYDNINDHVKDFEGQGEIVSDKGVIIRYIKENPFEVGSDSYKNYEIFLKTIAEVSKSIDYKK